MVMAVAFFIQACASQFGLSLEHGVFALIIRSPVPIVDEKLLGKVLENLKKPNISYEFHLVRDNGSFRDFRWGVLPKIATNNVVMIEVARISTADGLTPIGSSLTHRLYTTDPDDIAKVLGQVKPSD